MKQYSRLFLVFLFSFTSCSGNKLPEIELEKNVELSRYMGDWYVIACTPNFIEKNAFNSVESYKLESDGTVSTTFTYNEGDFTGPEKVYRPRGFVRENSGNAQWGMQFIWPFKGEYRIAYLDSEYQHTIVARNARDYVWIMARTPEIPEEKYKELLSKVAGMGYDVNSLRKVPHGKAVR